MSTASYGIAVNGNILFQEELVHIGDTDTKIKFPSTGDTISFETATVVNKFASHQMVQ